MLIANKDRFLVCVDENNDFYIIKNNLIEMLESNKKEHLEKLDFLNSSEKDTVLELIDFTNIIEEQFLKSYSLYSKASKRKIFYSSKTNIYFILEYKRGSYSYTVHPFKDFDALYLKKEEDVSSFSSLLALELGALSYDPVLQKLLEKS